MTTLIFLDIDGVLLPARSQLLVRYAGLEVDPGNVWMLNRIIEDALPQGPCHVVFNTSWNTRHLSEMAALLVVAGFEYPETLMDQTSSTSGCGGPLLQWFADNPERIGQPYLILDDSTSYPGAMWGRILHCDPDVGLSAGHIRQAREILSRDLSLEREGCVRALGRELHRLKHRTPWLSGEGREAYCLEAMRLQQEVQTDPRFLESAYLVRRPSSSGGA